MLMRPANTEFKDLAGKLKIPVDWVPVAGGAHDTRGLYVRVGLESLRFIEAGLAPPRPPPVHFSNEDLCEEPCSFVDCCC